LLNELKQNIETEIISRLVVLERHLKQFAGIVEKASVDLRNKLDSYNQELEQNHRQRTTQEGFLSDLWEESEMNANDIRIKMLKEDNEDLTKKLNYKHRSLTEAQDQVKKLKKEKNEWQELYLLLAPAKRPAETAGSNLFSDKRRRREKDNDRSRQSSSVEAGIGIHREKSRWYLKPELPCLESLSKRRMSETVVDLRKGQCRKINRYILKGSITQQTY
jgi:hypothetical protein